MSIIIKKSNSGQVNVGSCGGTAQDQAKDYGGCCESAVTPTMSCCGTDSGTKNS